MKPYVHLMFIVWKRLTQSLDTNTRIDPAFVDGTVLDCKTAKTLLKKLQIWQISNAQCLKTCWKQGPQAN